MHTATRMGFVVRGIDDVRHLFRCISRRVGLGHVNVKLPQRPTGRQMEDGHSRRWKFKTDEHEMQQEVLKHLRSLALREAQTLWLTISHLRIRNIFTFFVTAEAKLRTR